MTASSSTSITVSWQLPPADFRHGIIIGFKLFYKISGFVRSPTTLTIRNETTRTEDIIGLDKYTEYEFQVLAFTSVGDGPKSSVEVERTMEDGKKHVLIIAELNNHICYYDKFFNNGKTDSDNLRS